MGKFYFKIQSVYVLSLISLVAADFYSPTCKSSGWSCLNCKTRKLCMSTTLWEKKLCADNLSNSSLIYCNPKSNQCVAEEPVECKTTTEFTCPGNGLYPDLQNCTTFYKCTDGVKEKKSCESNEYFLDDWGKCMPKLSSSDCKIVRCSLTNTKNSLHEQSPLYYECKDGLLELKSCQSDQYFDAKTKTCNNICQKNSNSIFPDKKNCLNYFKCNKTTLELTTYKCPSGKGFNSLTIQCENNYDRMCNEITLLDETLNEILNKIPIVAQINKIIRSIFTLFKYNPLTLLLKFHINDNLLTKIILTINYIYENKSFPMGILSDLTDGILKYLPKPIRDVIETILKYIPLGKSFLSKRGIEDDSNTKMRLILFLENLRIDISSIINVLQNNNLSETKEIIQNYLIETYHLSQQEVLAIFNLIRSNLENIVIFLNENIGFNLFEIKNGTFNVNLNALNRSIDDKMNEFFYNAQEFNYLFGELLKSVYRNFKNGIINYLDTFFNL